MGWAGTHEFIIKTSVLCQNNRNELRFNVERWEWLSTWLFASNWFFHGLCRGCVRGECNAINGSCDKLWFHYEIFSFFVNYDYVLKRALRGKVDLLFFRLNPLANVINNWAAQTLIGSEIWQAKLWDLQTVTKNPPYNCSAYRKNFNDKQCRKFWCSLVL